MCTRITNPPPDALCHMMCELPRVHLPSALLGNTPDGCYPRMSPTSILNVY